MSFSDYSPGYFLLFFFGQRLTLSGVYSLLFAQGLCLADLGTIWDGMLGIHLDQLHAMQALNLLSYLSGSPILLDKLCSQQSKPGDVLGWSAWVTPGGTQRLLQVLCSGIAPGRLRTT